MKKLCLLIGLWAMLPSIWAQETQTWQIASPSAISYSASHPLHDWQGDNKSPQGILTTVNNTPQKMAILAQVRDFDSKNENRDAHAMEILHAIKHPQVRFSATSITPSGANTYQIAGVLDFHGIKRSTTLVVNAQKVAKGWQIRGSFPVSLTAHQVERPSFMMVKTKDSINIDFDLLFLEKTKP